MAHLVLFDIYERVRVTAEQTIAGAWVIHKVGTDGKRSRLSDVIVPDDKTMEDR